MTTGSVASEKLVSALRVLDSIATHYGAFQYKHDLRLVDPNTKYPSSPEEELRRVVSAIELLLVNNEVGLIDDSTGEYRSLKRID